MYAGSCRLLLLCLLLIMAEQVSANHVRAYCVFSADSMSVYEDENVKLCFLFNQKLKRVELTVDNKTAETIYIDRDDSFVEVNGTRERIVDMDGRKVIPLYPKTSVALYKWTALCKKLDKAIVTQGNYGSIFSWKPGRKGCFVKPGDGHKRRFQKGDVENYDFQTSPLSFEAQIAYATTPDAHSLQYADAQYFVSDIAIGKRPKRAIMGADVSKMFKDRDYFYFDSGGCNAFAYAGGKVLLTAGYAVAGIGILVFYVVLERAGIEPDEGNGY